MTALPTSRVLSETMACADCEAACLRMKEQGFRPWRGKFACYEHAAVDWDEFCAEHGLTFDDAPAAQPDLFATPSQQRAD